MEVREARKIGARRLERVGIDSPRLDADLLLCEAMGWDRSALLAHPEHVLSPEQESNFLRLIERRERREPLAYILGAREFYGLSFVVNPSVLIPRPETEAIVEIALDYLHRRNRPTLTVDVGTGSGTIVVAISLRSPERRNSFVATDASVQALSVAKQNVEIHHAPVHLVAADLLRPIAGPIQLLTANLPYIPTAELPDLQPEIRLYEPRPALDGGRDGLDVYRRLLDQARSRIDMSDGLMIMEIGADQGKKLAEMAKEAFPEGAVSIHRDLAGFDRVVTVRFRHG